MTLSGERNAGGGPQAQPRTAASRHERAVVAAETVLEAFYLQDVRESLLLGGRGGRANDVGRRAVDAMRTAFRYEFPHLPACRASRAGEAFMEALFLQDEIENWTELSAVVRESGADVPLYSDPLERYPEDVVADPRWEAVADRLRTVCVHADIDERYATAQTRFLRLHGEVDRHRWAAAALEAHSTKLAAMLPDEVGTGTTWTLARYFADGVHRHDEWQYRDRTEDFRGTLDVVVAYYETVFDLQSTADR